MSGRAELGVACRVARADRAARRRSTSAISATSGVPRRSVTSPTAIAASRTRSKARWSLSFDSGPERPFFRPIVTRTRKMLGDNPDALYYTAPVRADRAYRVTGNMRRQRVPLVHVEKDTAEGGYSTETAGVLRDADFDVAPDGSFEIFFGGPPRAAQLARAPARRVGDHRAVLLRETPNRRPPTRTADVPLTIEPLEPVGPPAPWDDASVAAGWRRVASVPAQPDARASRSPANVNSPRGCRRRRTSSRHPRCPARSRSPRSTPRTRWRRTCSARTKRW